MDKFGESIQGAGSLAGTLIVAPWLYHMAKTMAPDIYCPRENAYAIDAEGRVHVFTYQGRIPRPGEPGYPVPDPDDTEGTEDV